MFERILVPLDGSALAESALPLATSIAKEFASEVLILCVEEEDLSLSREGATANYAKSVREEIERAGISAQLLTGQGDIPQAIVSAATVNGASLIIMSTHGRTGRRTIEIGSVASGVLKTSRVPVLFSKPSEYRLPAE